MKRMMFLGALVLGVTVCSQSFAFELLDRMLGHKGCCSSCCEPGCDAGNGCCEPGCGAGNGCAEPACDAGAGCCEPACDAGAGCCGARKCRKKHDLFGGLKGLFHCKKHGCCEPACDAGNGCCEPACDAGNACCEPACDAGNGCCEPSCAAATRCRKKHGTPLRDLVRAIHAAKKRCHSSCCEPDCSAGCCEPGCGAEPACGAAPDCSASIQGGVTAVAAK